MNLTLSVVAGILLILPGLPAMAAWNIRANRSGATRPDLPLTAVSVLLIAIGVSLAAHIMSFMLVELVRFGLIAAGIGLPDRTAMPLPLQVLLTDGHDAAGLVEPVRRGSPRCNGQGRRARAVRCRLARARDHP